MAAGTQTDEIRRFVASTERARNQVVNLEPVRLPAAFHPATISIPGQHLTANPRRDAGAIPLAGHLDLGVAGGGFQSGRAESAVTMAGANRALATRLTLVNDYLIRN